MSADDKEEHSGLAIYADPVDRNIIDTAGHEDQEGEWEPMNNPAERLCKCLEGLRDIHEAVENFKSVQAPKKQRRRLRAIFVPLHSLCICIVDLINSLQSERSVHSLLPKNCTRQLTELRERFENLVPFGRKEKLGLLRNKVSGAHYDRDLTPAEMRDLLRGVSTTEVGEWINICLATLCDLLKLNAYQWSTKAPADNTAVILCEQPIPVMSVVDVDVQERRITGIRAIYFTKSPRSVAFETIKALTRSADALFESGSKSRFRIAGFHEDPPDVNWSALLRSTRPESK
jgi:hypothetical protein